MCYSGPHVNAWLCSHQIKQSRLPSRAHGVDMEDRTLLEKEIVWSSMEVPMLSRKGDFGQPKGGVGTLGSCWAGSEGRKQKRRFHKGRRPRKNWNLCFLFHGRNWGVSYKDFVGLLCIKFGKLHSSDYPISPSTADVASLSRGKNAVSRERSTGGNCQLVREEGGQTRHSCLGFLRPSMSSVQLWLFLGKTSIPCQFECLL